jgi:MFS family permease
MPSEVTAPLVLALLAGVQGAFQFGYNIGAPNEPESRIETALSMSKDAFGWAISMMAVGGMLGSLIAGRSADAFGRTAVMLANATNFVAAGLIMFYSKAFWMFALGRFIVGVGCGAATVLTPMYLGERVCVCECVCVCV